MQERRGSTYGYVSMHNHIIIPSRINVQGEEVFDVVTPAKQVWRGTASCPSVHICHKHVCTRPFISIFSTPISIFKLWHWLSVMWQIKFKFATIAYYEIFTRPPYCFFFFWILRNLGSFVFCQGKCAFFVTPTKMWNQLPITSLLSDVIAASLFEIAFPFPNHGQWVAMVIL